MDRELLLLLVALSFCGLTFSPFGAWRGRKSELQNAVAAERIRWLSLWLPLAPASIGLAGLLGWASQEPEPSERAPVILIALGVVVGIPVGRAVMRALLALLRPESHLLAGTVGLVSQYVVLSPALIHALDRAALDAVYEHELAHLRHRDPLRIWLAQLVCDLQWPWPGARHRFRRWQEALEAARDQEAREHGVPGEDLASGIVTAARLYREGVPVGIAGITGEGSALNERLALLLSPLSDSATGSRQRFGIFLFFGLIIGAAWLGVVEGHGTVNTLLRMLP